MAGCQNDAERRNPKRCAQKSELSFGGEFQTRDSWGDSFSTWYEFSNLKNSLKSSESMIAAIVDLPHLFHRMNSFFGRPAEPIGLLVRGVAEIGEGPGGLIEFGKLWFAQALACQIKISCNRMAMPAAMPSPCTSASPPKVISRPSLKWMRSSCFIGSAIHTCSEPAAR